MGLFLELCLNGCLVLIKAAKDAGDWSEIGADLIGDFIFGNYMEDMNARFACAEGC